MRNGDDLTTFIVPKVEKIRSLNFCIPKGLLRPVAGEFYLYLYLFNNSTNNIPSFSHKTLAMILGQKAALCICSPSSSIESQFSTLPRPSCLPPQECTLRMPFCGRRRTETACLKSSDASTKIFTRPAYSV